MRILVVDDDPDSLEVEQMMLSTEGADVRGARSVEDALAILRAFPADVIVTDIVMPEGDGFELLRQLRLMAGRIGRAPAMVLTAVVEEVTRAKAEEAGFATFVTKPADPVDFVHQVMRVVGISRQQPNQS